MTTNQHRQQFRETVFERDNNTCTVPWCDREAVDAHHIIERELWDCGGYIPPNGASVCSPHHKYAEENHIPPQAFWLWIAVATSDTRPGAFNQWDDVEADIKLPADVPHWQINKWGDEFDRPPWENEREWVKYQSTRHLLPLYWYDEKTTADERIEHDDTGLETVEDFVGVPLVITHKIDGGNCMITNDPNTPVRARNGKSPEETMKPLYGEGGLYWQLELRRKIPDRFQIFGEWVAAKHNIHYGCDCDEPCKRERDDEVIDDVGPSLADLTGVEDERAYLQIFGVYDKRLNLWLSWPMTRLVAQSLNLPTAPVIYEEDAADEPTFETRHEARQQLISYVREVINNGGEGIVVRRKFPYHYGQFGQSIGKYVRENHTHDKDDHWAERKTVINSPDLEITHSPTELYRNL